MENTNNQTDQKDKQESSNQADDCVRITYRDEDGEQVSMICKKSEPVVIDGWQV